jgi:hypothetical protein
MSSQTTQAPPPAAATTGKKQIAAKHRDLIAAAEVCDVLDALDASTRLRVMRFVLERYPMPGPVEPDKVDMNDKQE